MLVSAVIYSYLFMLIVGSVLPSDGNHGIFAPKSVAFLSAAFFFGLYAISRWQIRLSQAWAALIVCLATFFFALWYVIGIDQNPQIASGQFDQFKVFMTTLFVPFATWWLLKDNLIDPAKIIRTVIYANFTYCAAKVTLMALHLLNLINVWSFMHKTGLRFMSMNIIGDVGRIQTSIDILTPFLMYFVLQSNLLDLKLSRTFKCLFFIFALASTFLSFSRLLIFAFAISVLFYGLTLKLSGQIKFWAITGILFIAAVFAIGPEKVERVIERRLFSSDNHYSDVARKVQIDAMLNACDENPILGNGLGGYNKECIRDWKLPHAYEVQWIAFLMQFGALGLTLILIPVGLLSWKLIEPPFSRERIGFFLLFGLWLSSGFTNPFLISLTSGIVYALFLLAAEISLKPRAVLLRG